MAECGAEGDALEFPPDQGVAVGLTSMLHRYLNHERFTLAAIDDVIARGRQSDWFDQRRHQGVSTDFPPFRIIVRVIRRSFGQMQNRVLAPRTAGPDSNCPPAEESNFFLPASNWKCSHLRRGNVKCDELPRNLMCDTPHCHSRSFVSR